MNKKELLGKLEEMYHEYRDEYDRNCDSYYEGMYSALDLAMQEVEKLDEQ